MNKTPYFVLDYYNRYVVNKIIEKYRFTPMDAIKSFMTSETHDLLEDADYGLIALGAPAIFDMWEAEKITGNPRNSIYIRGE